VLQELLSIFRPGDPLNVMAEEFARMLKLTCEMNIDAGDIYFGQSISPEARTKIYKTDVKVNKLERRIRKAVVAHLSIGDNRHDLPYCLALMSLVKDVERLGDYAKNLSEAADLRSGDLPEDEILAELKEIRSSIEMTFQAAARAFAESDREQALELIRQGKDDGQRADGLLTRIAHSDHDAATVTALALGARYYKRIGGHLLNVLSSVVMPLHKIDYYDEDEIPAEHR
jgi:phosphate uptake regulator